MKIGGQPEEGDPTNAHPVPRCAHGWLDIREPVQMCLPRGKIHRSLDIIDTAAYGDACF